MLAQLDDILAQITASEEAATAGYPQIKSFLYRWILGHIIKSDAKIGTFLKAIDYSGELPLIRVAA